MDDDLDPSDFYSDFSSPSDGGGLSSDYSGGSSSGSGGSSSGLNFGSVLSGLEGAATGLSSAYNSVSGSLGSQVRSYSQPSTTTPAATTLPTTYLYLGAAAIVAILFLK